MRLPPRLASRANAPAARPRQLVLGRSAGSERVARRRVEHQPQLELVVGDRVADVGVVGAGRDGPVDVARVVAGHVRPGLAALGAVTGEQPGMVAGQQPVEAADGRQLQRLDGRGATAR